ncbi:MAG: 50S ribosomal protein L29 [Candidatus Pacebacteria bacterium]|nr:50S ribosomal protein L29 [Candidatus Paceibacterota bacterium]
MVKKIDLKKKTEKDLHKSLLEKRAELREFRFALSGSKIKNIKKARALRRMIARILTELNFRVRNTS